MKPYDLVGKRILVTGASSGIGRACAICASQLGASVVLTGRRVEALTETLSKCAGEGHSVVAGDISSPEFVSDLVERGGKLGFPRRELHPASPWGYALVRGADGAFACEASTVSLGENPFRPGCAPVTLRMKAVSTSFGGWGYMREGASARAIDPPPSPVPSAGTPTTTVELVPFGSTQIRISLFPWTQFAR